MATQGQDRFTTVNRSRTVDQAEMDLGLRDYMLRVYNYMATGLAVSGLVAWLVANTALQGVFFSVNPETGMAGPNLLGLIGMFGPLGLLFAMMYAAHKSSASTLQAMYWAFVALQGISLSLILMMYTGESVMRVFFITAASFAGLSLFGYTTKRDLSGFGSFLVMGLIGLLIAMVVNIFVASSMLMFVISAAGVLIFAGLTAYYTQEIKLQYSADADSETQTKGAIMGAITLYLAFINLFQFLMMFLGQRE
ncbi:Bax inhibitor-1/YccA family protein [Fodinicurvata sp. EGI_FJ10296]|uniref:Bax inhibitor-1/YccA family protein n=1 Tax=Fodinicurvata sp. EGI_FJ10296 TaxID=3231908 RepID=UPI00345216A9